MINVSEITANDAAANPPKLTEVAPVKPMPLILSLIPAGPDVGVKEEMDGPVKIKPGKLPLPAGVVTLTLPEDPFPTIAVILVPELTMKDEAANPPNFTEYAPVKPAPVILTDVPTLVATGVKDVITGGEIKINPDLVAVPNAVFTDTSPLEPLSNKALIVVDDEL
ncbi:MAG TPA: hypothetical protein VK498_11035 [Ferruginibacter sp.]|nr:hypothetical protein [Ferruginibacter sp.]